MEEKIGKLAYFNITVVLCLMLIGNMLFWQNQTVGIAASVCYISFFSFIYGSIFVNKKGWQLLFGLLFLLATISLAGAIFLYFYALTTAVVVMLILLIPCFLIFPYYQTIIKEKFSLKKIWAAYVEKFLERREPKINILLVFGYSILAAGLLFLLWKGQTAESIQSPWQVVSPKFFIGYFAATVLLITYVLRSTRTKLPLLLLIIHTAISSSVAVIVYTIGYGFDPFIHQATEKIISQTGLIAPKPLYYLGQYALVVFLQKISLVNISVIDRLLVPAMFALFIPTTTFYTFSHWLTKKYALVLPLVLLTIPYSGFIMTAPQNLANLLFIISILLSLLYFKNLLDIKILLLLGITTLAIHPLAGIPLLVTLALLALFKLLYTSYSRYISLYILAAVVFIIFLPLAFISNGSGVTLALPRLHRADLYFLTWVDKFDLPLNLTYLIGFNLAAAAAVITGLGIWYIAKHKLLKNNSGYLMAGAVTLADFFIAKYFLTFPALSDYDKVDFVNRILLLAFYTILPFFLVGAYWSIRTFWLHDRTSRIFVVGGLAGLVTISLYLSYPQLNQFAPAKFFSLGQSDIKSVYTIEQTASPNHIVLANQMIGVAAIKEFGFKQYYQNQFYYSMPNGSPHTFYDYYLEMVYQGATRQTMEKAMAEANVPQAYFVLNKYWRDSDKIAKLAVQSADSMTTVDNGAVLIFKYNR